MGRLYLYLHLITIKINEIHVGKYIYSPMGSYGINSRTVKLILIYIIVGLAWWFENPRIPENESGTIKLEGTMIKGPKPTGPKPIAETQGCKKQYKTPESCWQGGNL